MFDYELAERRNNYIYHRMGLRRMAKCLLVSLFCMCLLVFLSYYCLKTYPQTTLYVTTTEGMLFDVNLHEQKDFSGNVNVGVYLAKDRLGQPTYGVVYGQ